MKRDMKQFYIVGIFWIVFFHSIGGQSSYVFHFLETKDGLSNNTVKAILRDSYGFLWIGTEVGLNRYDGYGFRVYNMRFGVPKSLLSNDISELQEDGLGNIWVYIGYTYMVYDRDKDCFNPDIKQLLLDLGIQSEESSRIFVDKNKNLWVFNTRSAYFFDVKKKSSTVFKLDLSLNEEIASTITDNSNFLYTILKSGVCWQMNKITGVQTLIELPDLIKQNVVYNRNMIYADSNNGLWISSSLNDLVFYRKKPSSKWERIYLTSDIKSESNSTTSIIENQTGQIWIGTDHKGIFIYDKVKNAITNIVSQPSTSTSLSSNSVRCLYRDNNETIWIGHYKKGLSFYHESFRNFINFQHPECTDITTILEDRKGNLWLGTDGNGVFVKEKNSDNIVEIKSIPKTAIITIIEDRKGRVWIGTYMKGLFCYENGKIVQYTTNNSKLSSNDIWGLKEDRYGNIWIGALGGKIQILQSDSKGLQSLISPFNGKDYAMDMFYDGGDKMYIGTVYGLSVIDITNNKRITYFGNKRESQLFMQLKISNVFKDGNGNIWLGHNDGLTIWNQKKDTLYTFSKENGLCDNSIRGITEDNLKKIWVTTSNGLSILTVNHDINDDLTISSKNYSVKDGLKNTYFNNHSICKLRNGDIALGNVDGFSIFNPNRLAEKNQVLAKVIFTELTVGNKNIQVDSIYNGSTILEKSIELTKELTFKYNDKLISLHFTTGDLLNSDKVKYVYQIDGFDSQWIPIADNKIIISSLPAGKYKLLIKACNSDGVWNDVPTILNIKVTPPFYASIWAYIIYVILIIGLMIYYIRRKEHRHKLKLEQQRIQLDHEKEIHVKEIKLRFFTNISHDLRTPLTLIITPLQLLLNDTTNESLHKKLSNIYKNAQQLLILINSLLDFRKLDVGAETLNLKPGDFVHLIREVYASFCVYADERKINFTFSSEMKSLSMQFDHSKIQKTVTNLLSNAFKYTPDGGYIGINIYQQEDFVYVSVSDSGNGINDEEKTLVFERFYQAPQKQEKTGSGIGLHIADGYVKLHGGSITVSDNMPKGSVFTFKIPIINVEITENTEIDEIVNEVQEEETIIHPKSSDIPKLLFVDDNKDLCDFIEDNLGNDYSVITAYNGQDALEKLHNNDISIVVSDIMMPIMGGTELCKQIKTNILLSHIPVILLTARTAEDHKIEGLELGADDYITKPFNFNILKLRIQKFLEWTERSHQVFSQKIDVSPAEITITSLDEKLIEKAIKVVEEHMSDNNFSVETLGVTLGLSRGHLYKKLMVITGKGPAEFIRTIRLKRGRQLLEKSQLQIAEIAYEVGYNSPKRFTINFREEFGMAPSEYLRSLKQDQYVE